MIYRDNLTKHAILKLFVFFVSSFLFFKSGFGQSLDSIRSQGLQRLNLFGYSLSGSSRLYQLKSNIAAIDQLTVPSYGVNAGVVFADERGALRAQAGMHYGSASLPYSIDVMEIGLSKTIYLLRLNHVKYHTFEPYVIADIAGQRASFFGNYLESRATNKNQSTSDEQLLGRVSYVRTSIGLGVEYQLASTDSFLNFFAEVKYGAALYCHASESEFSSTHIKNPISIDVGVNFGKLIFR